MVNLKTHIILLNQNKKKCYFDIKFRIVNSIRYKELHLMYFKSVKTYFCVCVNGTVYLIYSVLVDTPIFHSNKNTHTTVLVWNTYCLYQPRLTHSESVLKL